MTANILFGITFLTFVSNYQQYEVVPSINDTRIKLSDDDGKGSLVFVFDTTGSMFNDLRQLREGAEMILKTALEDSNVIANFVFVPFHDPAVGPATVTKDKQVFKSALNIVRVYGGGDCPEKSLTGILMALKVSKPRSFIYVFTDATASDHKLVGSVLDSIQKMQSQVVFVLTGHCNDLDKPSYKVYQQIAAASSGQVFNLNKSSVYKVLEFVRASIKGRTVNLGSAFNPAGYNYTQKIPVDKSVGEVTVSVSGSKPQIKVVNPSGKELTGPPQLVTTLDLSEIMIVRVLEPEPGNWSIIVGSEEEHSVKVVGLSNLTFQHGFSLKPPNSLEETTYRPLQDAYNHMMIYLSETNISLQLERVQLLGLDGKNIFEVPLKEIDKKTYVADAFVPPNDFFNIAIIGHDEFGQELRRVGPTAVQVKRPDVPELTVPQRIMARTHERVRLLCHSRSAVPQEVAWNFGSLRLMKPENALETATVEYVIKDMSEGNVGVYHCVATNVAGQSRASTVVDLIVDLPRVNISTANTTISEHGHLAIACTIFSEALLQRTQLVFNGTFRNYSVDMRFEPSMDGYYKFRKMIPNVTEKNSGLYTCVAANRAGYANDSMQVTVQVEPTAQILGPHTISKSEHSDVQLVCHVENALQIQWLHNNKTVYDSKQIDKNYNAVLDVKNVTDDGIWTCKAIRDSYNAFDTIELIVLKKPQVVIEGVKNITVLNGTTHELVCTIVAKPKPRILWHMETERFLPNVITNPKPNVYKSVLTLDSQKEPINGTYFCFGENAEGIDQDSATINVRRKMVLIQGFTDISTELFAQIDLICNIDSYPPPNITWYHNDTRIQTNDNVDVSGNNTVVKIHKVNFDELGLYICKADNGFENMTVSGTLRVHGLEKPVIIKKINKIVTQKGKTAEITCRIHKGKPKPSITWYYKHNSTEYSVLPDGVTIKDENIVIVKIKKSHSGIYRCTAENILGADMNDVELIVQYPPEFNVSQESHLEGPIEMKSGVEIKLSCNVSGIPPPIVTWTKDGYPVTYSTHVYLSNDSVLVIANATAFDSGVFKCNASSALGFVTKEFNVAVYQPPQITVPQDQEVSVREGELVVLHCDADGAPSPHLAWLKDGHLVTSPRLYVDEYGLRFVANVTDFGEYTCLASNQYGNASLNYTVYVWVPPHIEPPLETVQDVVTGSNVHLECDAVGFPLPVILWEYQDELLSENTTDLSFDEVGNLYINNISSKYEGLFACVAENIAGDARKNFIVNVIEKPKILDDNYTSPYLASDLDTSLSISCRATGRPRPFIAWIKDGYYLDKDSRYDIEVDGTLTIKSPTQDLSGEYTCVATNSAGNDTRNMSVEVYSLPTLVQEEKATSVATAVEGSEMELQCPVMHADTVKWYKDASLISTGALKFPNVSRSDEAEYTCVATNLVGSALARVALQVQWPPVLGSPGDEDLEVLQGVDHYFHCETDAKPRAKTKWLFNSKPIFGEDKEVLRLLNVRLRHTGVYECVARNEHGTVRKRFSFDVLEPPFISDFDLLDVQLKSGINATLECVAKGSPKPMIEWSFNNTKWSIVNTTITTNNVTQQSEGLFRCNARNKAGIAHLVYNIVVVASATVDSIVMYFNGEGTRAGDRVELTLGSRVRIACKAVGSPSPIVQWIRYGNTVSQNSEGINYADLMFDRVTISDNGDYTCIASNEVGIQEKKIKVQVLEPPRIFQTLVQNANHSQTEIDLKVIVGQAFYMHCHPYGNPLPEIYWFKNGFPLRFYDDTMVSSDFGEIIISKSAKEEQSANYTCVARNKVGEASVVYLVDVLVPPPIHKDNIKHASVLINNTLNLTCPAEGRPMPYVMWFKHPFTEVIETPRVKLLDDNYTLIITETKVSDSGKYSCTMTNKVGATELIYDVVILKPPTIIGNKGNNTQEEHVVDLRKSVVLKCEVDGNPMPNVTWYKDVQRLSDNEPAVQNVRGGSLLVLWGARERDAGPYVCVAESSAGTAHYRHLLRVRVPGKWSPWSQWSYCNVTCGLGYQRRSRRCQYIDDNDNIIDKLSQPDKIILDESSCKGSTEDRRKCHMPACEEEAAPGRWSSWSRWGRCSASCGAGTQARTRRCLAASPCVGDNVQIRKCPGLPKCRMNREKADNKQKNEDDAYVDSDYLPEATFEMDSDHLETPQPEGYDDYFIPPGSPQKLYYDVKVTENLDQSEQGPCEPGHRYIAENDSCEDIDECLLETNACHLTQVCRNTAHGYRCSCPSGYYSLGVGQRCLDVNECVLGRHACEFACVNAAGGYVCACPPHLRLHSDRHHCVPPSSSYRKPYVYEDDKNEDYISTSVEYLARKRRH